MVKVLLTGGAGFIGSHVATALAARGDAVTVLDNFNDFYDPAIKRANARELVGATIVAGDIRDAGLVSRLFSEGGFDAVITWRRWPACALRCSIRCTMPTSTCAAR